MTVQATLLPRVTVPGMVAPKMADQGVLLHEVPVPGTAAPRTAGQGVLLHWASALGMSVPRMTVQVTLLPQMPVPGMVVSRVTLRATLVPRVFPLVVSVTIPGIAVPLGVLCDLQLFLGFLVVQVYFVHLESHLVLFLVFSRQNKTKSPISIVVI